MKAKVSHLLVVLFVSLIPTAQVLKNELVWDDEELILTNPHLSSWSGLPRLWTGAYWQTRTDGLAYRPISHTLILLDGMAWGARAAGFHWTNLWLHSVNAVLVYLVGLALLGPRAAMGGALLFAVHPVHVEAIALVENRSELLAAASGLLAVLWFLDGTARESVRFAPLAASLACLAFACLSKETAVTIPLLLGALAIWAVPWGRRLRAVAATVPFFVLAALVMLLRPVKPEAPLRASWDSLSPSRLLEAARILGAYLSNAAFPVRLTTVRELSSVGAVHAVAAGVFAICFAYDSLRRRASWCLLCWTAVALAPSLNLFARVPRAVGDQRFYLPSVALCLWLASKLVNRRSAPSRTGAAAFALALSVLACGMVHWELKWQNSYAFWRDVVAKHPHRGPARVNFSRALLRQGWTRRAERQLTIATEESPDFAFAYADLGSLHQMLGRYRAAAGAFRQCLRLDPDNRRAQLGIARCWHALGELERAAKWCAELLQADPSWAEAHLARGILLAALGRTDEAAGACREAVRLAPDLRDAHRTLGDLARSGRRWQEALSHYGQALDGHADADARTAIGDVRRAMGDWRGASSHYEQALIADPFHALAKVQLANVYTIRGNLELAERLLREAVKLDSTLVAARFNLARILLRRGNVEAARRELREALKTDSSFAPARDLLKEME